MKIAILGWGSLIYEPRGLPIGGPWQADGPTLWIEFSRISQSGDRAGCLTLIIDEMFGSEVKTLHVLSQRNDLAQGIVDLKKREDTPLENIGFCEVATGRFAPKAWERHPASCERIRAWARGKGFDAVIWAALGRRFKDVVGVPFSPAEALKYLKDLPTPTKEKALKYINSAPEQTMTTFRHLVLTELGEPNPKPQLNGPFSDTEVSVYCDESRHEGQRHQKYMVIGGLWLPREQRTEILAGLRAVQAQYGITGELKWGKVSRTKLPGYQAVVNFIASRADVHFRCIVVDKSKVDNDKYFQNDRQLGFWVYYWYCLKQWMGNRNTYFISIDFKPESLHSGPRRLRQVLENECIKRGWLKSLECVDSQHNPLCQVADVLIGAVGYEQNGLAGSPAKAALASHIATRFDRPDLKGSDVPSRLRFSVWRIWS